MNSRQRRVARRVETRALEHAGRSLVGLAFQLKRHMDAEIRTYFRSLGPIQIGTDPVALISSSPVPDELKDSPYPIGFLYEPNKD